MIYIMSQKFFEKKIQKMANHNPYFGLDGENWAVTGNKSDGSAISTKYSNMHTVGGFCPETRLYEMLRKKKRGDDINERKLSNEIDAWINDQSLISSVAIAFKCLLFSAESMNVFVILPNVVYKYLGRILQKRMIELADLDFDCVFTQEDLKESMKPLNSLLSKGKLKKVEKSVKHMEKKYKLKHSGSSYDDDDDWG